MDVVSSPDRRSLVRSAKEVEPELPRAGRVEKGQKHPVSNRGRRHTEHILYNIGHGTGFLIQAGALADVKVETTARIEFQSLVNYGPVHYAHETLRICMVLATVSLCNSLPSSCPRL